jgi:hypothetical protein
MSEKVYRLCLIALLFAGIIAGIVYFMNHAKNQTSFTEGTLVQWWDEDYQGEETT